MNTASRPVVLTVAGSDPSSGAGLQADLFTFNEFGCNGRSVVTAITAQTNDHVLGVWPTEGDVLTQQLSTAASKVELIAMKIGMVATAQNVWALIWFLRSRSPQHVIIDPLLHSSSGLALLEKKAVAIFQQQLLPYATVITPNIPEAMALAGMQISTVDAMEVAAKAIYNETLKYRGARQDRPLAVIIKGGHLKRDPVDVVWDGEKMEGLTGPRLPGGIHGSGCRYASAVTASLAKGATIVEAAQAARTYVAQLIAANARPVSVD